MFALVGRTLQFLVLHFLVKIVNHISRLARNSNPPEVMHLLRENIALKALVLELKAGRVTRPSVSMRTRAAQTFADAKSGWNAPLADRLREEIQARTSSASAPVASEGTDGG